MRNRTLLLGTLALGIIAAVFVFTDKPAGDKISQVETALVPADLLADLRTVEITTLGQNVKLERTDKGWVVPARFNLPVDTEQRLRPLLRSLRSAKTLGVLTADPRRMERLDLTNTLTLTGADGKPWKMVVGKMTDDGLGTAVQLAGETQALRSTFNALLEGSPANWIDPVIASFAAEQVVNFDLTLPDGSRVQLTRSQASEPFKGAEGPLLAACEELLFSLTTLRAVDAVALNDAAALAALAKPMVAKVTLKDGAVFTIKLGRGPSNAGDPPQGWMQATHTLDTHPTNQKSALAFFLCPPWLAEQIVNSVAELTKRGVPPEAPGLPTLEVDAVGR